MHHRKIEENQENNTGSNTLYESPTKARCNSSVLDGTAKTKCFQAILKLEVTNGHRKQLSSRTRMMTELGKQLRRRCASVCFPWDDLKKEIEHPERIRMK